MNRLDEARQLVNNSVFKEVLEKLYRSLENAELRTDPSDIKACQALIITRQQIAQIEINIHAIIKTENAKVDALIKEEERERLQNRPNILKR